MLTLDFSPMKPRVDDPDMPSWNSDPQKLKKLILCQMIMFMIFCAIKEVYIFWPKEQRITV